MLHYKVTYLRESHICPEGAHTHFNGICLFTLGIHNVIVANVINLFLKKEILRHMAIHTGEKSDPCTKCENSQNVHQYVKIALLIWPWSFLKSQSQKFTNLWDFCYFGLLNLCINIFFFYKLCMFTFDQFYTSLSRNPILCNN